MSFRSHVNATARLNEPRTIVLAIHYADFVARTGCSRRWTLTPRDRIKTQAGRLVLGSLAGFLVGVLGGLIGLGGAEFRLPLLIGAFQFPALEAVILNKSASLVVVASGLVFRAQAVPLADVINLWPVIATLLAGSLIGAWIGAAWAARLGIRLYKIIAVLLIGIAVVLLMAHNPASAGMVIDPIARTIVGVLAGFVIGTVASLLGVAGGELLIPTLVLVFGLDLKTAGSVSLAISLPTMIVGLARYSREQAFLVLRRQSAFVVALAGGSLVGVAVGGQLVRIVPTWVLLPILAVVMVVSAMKIWRHR